ncbi:MAG: tetratricopeptide repeat protein [Chiayiivirga sp.]|uniref:tetratricopeptide repeat protein n=1 Tax=Chiayiivirga sp. TaxID=2041042 RepID=UPI0025B8F5B5|nr:tetratricopeptide repeat protein [Chiayiivirga sp.]MCI1710419.1 tetratricopeptide repeat protein [Chiayiivirga sp.]MCI1730814.1 tetratricopeptide repeat protein [Chiayiivirga sp.]
MKVHICLVYLLLAATASGGMAAHAADASLEALLEGEFALQEGEPAAAAAAYVRAAELSDDASLSERAAQVSLLADDFDLARRALARWRALAPAAEALRPAEAQLALKTGDQIGAAIALRELLHRPKGWRDAVRVLASAGESLNTSAILSRLVRDDALPDEFDAWLAFGGLAQRLQLKELGEELAERAIRRFPESPRAWLWQAEVAQRRKDNEAARAAIAKAVQFGPLDTETRLAVAAQLDALGDPKAAAAALASGEQDDTTLAGRAAYLARADDESALTELYESAAAGAESATPARLYLLGQLAELREQTGPALDWYGRIGSGLQREQARLRIAVLLDKTGKLDDALARLRELQASDSDYGEVLRDAYLLEAELLQKHQRSDEAIDAYARGLAIFEDDPELIYARALGHERRDDIAAAEADLRRLIELDPEDADALNALGYTLADRTDRYQEALDLIQRALKLKPDTPAIVDSLGWVLYRMGRTEEALPHLRRAFELQRDAEVAAHLGEVLWMSGDKDEARSIWRVGRELDPDNRALKQVLERLDR